MEPLTEINCTHEESKIAPMKRAKLDSKMVSKAFAPRKMTVSLQRQIRQSKIPPK